jgi:hypothetical protein
LLGIGLIALAGCTTPPRHTHEPVSEMMPLKLYWDGRDNYTVATVAGEQDAAARGYHFVRIEGYVFTRHLPGTTALQQYWSESRHDFWLLPRDIPKNVQKNGQYVFIRVEGYVYTNAQPGTVPLKSFSLVRGDNFLTPTQQGETDARAAGYGLRHLGQGYIIPAVPDPIPTATNPVPATVSTNHDPQIFIN